MALAKRPAKRRKVGVLIDENSPDWIEIGTEKAFSGKYSYPYKKEQLDNGDWAYVLAREVGIQEKSWASQGESIIIIVENDHYVAYTVTSDGEWRQPVFRSNAAVLTEGEHLWEVNQSSSAEGTVEGTVVKWSGGMKCRTKHPDRHRQLSLTEQAAA
jgi:hypothetical protein